MYQICVLPDKRIRDLSPKPYFSIIEEMIGAPVKEGVPRKNKFDVKNFKTSTDFYEQINREAIQNMRMKKARDFYSSSLSYAKRNKSLDPNAATLYTAEELQAQLKEKQEEASEDKVLKEAISELLENSESPDATG